MSVGQFDWGGLLNLGRLDGNIENVLGCMLETPFASRVFPVTNLGQAMKYPKLVATATENALGADNQQGSRSAHGF